MKNLRTLLRCLHISAAVLATACLASCYAYYPGGYYGATTGTGPDGDGKGTQRTEEYSPPPVTYAPERPVYAGAGYYPAYYGVGYWPRYYYSHDHYGGGHYYGGHGGSHYYGGGGHYGRR